MRRKTLVSDWKQASVPKSSSPQHGSKTV
jgi:hypothetical protein